MFSFEITQAHKINVMQVILTIIIKRLQDIERLIILLIKHVSLTEICIFADTKNTITECSLITVALHDWPASIVMNLKIALKV